VGSKSHFLTPTPQKHSADLFLRRDQALGVCKSTFGKAKLRQTQSQVFTWTPEPVPGRERRPTQPPTGRAAAAALTPEGQGEAFT